MAIKTAINGKDLIEALMVLTGKDYCRLIPGITVIADIDDAVKVEVRMLAEQPKNKEG